MKIMFCIFACVRLVAATAAPAIAQNRREQQVEIENTWAACLGRFATSAAKQNERAEVIAEAAFAACQQHGNDLFAFIKSHPRPGVGDYANENLLPAIRKNLRSNLLAVILAERGAKR